MDIIFLIGLAFLIFFSYKDLKYMEIENKPIIALLILGLVISIINKKVFYLIPFCLISLILWLYLWKNKAIGGADVKILSILPLFYLSFSPNLIAGQIIFLTLFGVLGTIYALISLKINKKRHIPFLPCILLTYVVYFLFWTI